MFLLQQLLLPTFDRAKGHTAKLASSAKNEHTDADDSKPEEEEEDSLDMVDVHMESMVRGEEGEGKQRRVVVVAAAAGEEFLLLGKRNSRYCCFR